MSTKRQTEPAVEPLAIEDARQHLRVWDTAEDVYIDSLIVAAREWCENYLRRSLVTSTWKQTLNRFPPCGVIEIARPNLISVESVQYVDGDGATQTLPSSQYAVDTHATPGRVMRGYGVTWPTIRTSGTPNPVTINYTSGYGSSADNVPQSVKHAMLLMIGHWYENRETVVIGKAANHVPEAAKSLLATECWGDYP